ncbi:MAG: hypothetical protein H6734_23990 [Alphaproteobacteria bacterium]|nr:hypothetical protein [Alphaproteobacteria bacterium]
MAGIKVGAHPLIVAVAMGLLGPGAVASEREERGDRSLGFALDVPEDDAQDFETPTAEDFARVEDLWHEVRELV